MKQLLKKLFIFPILFFCSCKKGGCFEEAGSTVSITRKMAAFHQITLYDNIDLVLTQDTTESIIIETGKYLEPQIITDVKDGILSIKNSAGCNLLKSPSQKIIVLLHINHLDYITYAGSGNISCTNTLEAEGITIYSKTGAGNIDVRLHAKSVSAYIMDENADFTFHGSSDVCNSYTNARGSINFSDFVVKNMIIEYGSVRDATINVTENLNSIIYFKGNLFYKGMPTISKDEVHSTGKLQHVN